MNMPSLKNLLRAAENCKENYDQLRQQFDTQRFFNPLRPRTYNPEREQDIGFIQKLSATIDGYKFSYGDIDTQFEGQNYHTHVAPFLKNVLAGSFFLVLTKISHSYTYESKVKTNSALGHIILELFGVEKPSDIPDDTIQQCLAALSQFMTAMNSRPEQSPIQWRENTENQELLDLIGSEIQKLAACEATVNL
ncbi:MAG: hypothetical protein JJT82_09590 [Legionellaceae bacterium]|nr:hypothetical protein [Legionellaceae bacterium]